jgi:hypothetical protein
MDSNLTDRYNAGLVPPPQPDSEALRLPRPNWIPTPAQVETARQTLRRNLLILALVMAAVYVILWLIGGA